MLPRHFVRKVIPLTYQFFKITAVSQTLKHVAVASPRVLPLSSSNGVVPRWYSQEARKSEDVQLPVVDFDYVKKATAQNDILIIDVRDPDEIKEHGKIPNSINIPVANISTTLALSEKDFQNTFNRSKPKENTEIIFYCLIGKRSTRAQNTAVDLGFKNTKNYLGSWTDWVTKTQ